MKRKKRKKKTDSIPNWFIAETIGMKLLEYGFAPMVIEEDGMIVHRPLNKIGPVPGFPEIPSDARTLDIDFDPIRLWILDLPVEEEVYFDKRYKSLSAKVDLLLRGYSNN